MPSERPVTEPLNGLKSQVHRPPLSLSMVSVPPTLGWAVVPPPDVDEPQADATTAITASAAASVRRCPLISIPPCVFPIAPCLLSGRINRLAGSGALERD